MIKGAFKQRMVGAIFILSLGVILIPVILNSPNEDSQPYYTAKPDTPALPEVSELSQINYVFNEIASEPQVVAQVEEPSKPEVQPVTQVVKAPAVTSTVAPTAAPTVVSTKPNHPGDWTIQLGAFSSSDNAKELLRRLSQEGFESYLKETPGKKLVRVFVAPGVEKEKAQALISKLDSEFGIKGILVRYQEP